MKKAFILTIIICVRQICSGQNIGNIINEYTEVTGFNSCNNELTVTNASKFNIGDTVLIIQMKGAVIDSSNTANFGTVTDYKNSGNYEFNIIKQKNGNALSLLNVLERQYDIPDGKVQLIRVPYYQNINITSTLTCLPWDGSKGGVLVLNVANSLQLNANIDVSAKGFRGGMAITNPLFNCGNTRYFVPANDGMDAALKGEGVYNTFALMSGRGKLANGGGGGDATNSGGAGGGNGGTGGSGGNQYIGCGITGFANGGVSGSNLPYSNGANKIFLGGGGGAGHENDVPALGSGGNGGGIAIINCTNLISNAFSINSNGETPIHLTGTNDDGRSGGGSGGTVLLNYKNIAGNTTVSVKGGNGDYCTPPQGDAHGPGGGGGGGTFWINQPTISPTISLNLNGGANGTNTNLGNNPWGATAGKVGFALTNLILPVAAVPFKVNIDSVRIKESNNNCKSFDFKGLAYVQSKPISNWSWDFGDGTIANNQNVSHVFSKNGTYTVKLIVTDINGCKDSTIFFAKVNCTTISNIINDYTEVTGYEPCNNELFVNDASKYNIGDTVLIIQMKGAVIDSTNTPNFGTVTDYKNAGNYEFNIIKQKNGNALSLLNILERQYDIPDGKVQLVRVPYYQSINTTSTLTCLPWDGSKGGVLAFNVKGNVNMLADIDVSGKGFRHGTAMNSKLVTMNEQSYYYDPSVNKGAQKGEGIYSISTNKNYGRGASSNGGGGGNAHNSGGGGGANGGSGGEGGDQWQTGKTIAENVGGKGGKALTNSSALNKLYLGGSGGMGQANDLSEYPSGNGGGIIIFTAGSLNSNNFSIKSNGDNAIEAPNSAECKDGMAGGGGGGSILLDINSLMSSVVVEAKGGKGADHIANNVMHGPGGGGGGGVIAIRQLTTPPQYNFNLSPGINGVNVNHSNNPYGATAGSAGILINNFKPVFDQIIFKKNIDSIRFNESIHDCNQFDFNGIGFTQTSSINNWDWNFGDGSTSNSQNPTHTFAMAGTYNIKLIATDINGCKDSVLKPVIIKTFDVTKSPDTSLCGSSAINIFATGGSLYSWSPATGLDNPNSSSPVATPLVSTKYYVTVTSTDGCSKKDSVNILVNSLPVISKSNDTSICNNTPVSLLAGGGISYSWSPSVSLNNPNIATPVATPTTTTTYFVRVTNVDGCSKTDSVKVSTNPIPSITKSNDTTICNKASVKISVAGGSSYSWTPTSSLDNSTSSTPLASPLSTTLYRVSITDAYSCLYTDSVKIIVRDAAVFSVSPDSFVCFKTPRQLTASGGTTYLWSPASFLDNPNISNPVSTPDTTIIYSVTIKENVCNESTTLFTKLTVLPLPLVVASKSNDINCSFPSSHLTAKGAQNYSWSPANSLNNPAISNPIATPTVSTIYSVTGKDLNGCTGTDTIEVKASPYTNVVYELPNSFTPNGDGKNDCFGIAYWGMVQELDFSIYNRFGEKVFHTNDNSVCWDGKYKGQLQDANAFIYIVKAKTACGIIERKGTVMLLK